MEVIMSSPVQECSQMENNNCNDALKLTKSQKKIRRRGLKKKLNANLGLLEKGEDTENPKSKPEAQLYTISQSSVQNNINTGISSAGTGDGKSSNSKGKEHTEVVNGEMGSSMATDLNGEVEVQKTTETAISNTSSGTNATDNTALRKRKKTKNNNPDLGDIISTRESTREGLSMTKVLEIKSGETVLTITATPDANMVSKEQGHTEVANGKTGESETTDLNVNGNDALKLTKSQKKNRRRALKKKLNANLGSLGKGEDTENPKTKPEAQFYTISQSSLQNNPNTGISSVGTGEMGSSLTTNLNGEVEVQKTMETTSGNTSSGTNATDNTALKKRERKRRKNNNPDLDDIISTCESTQEGLSTTNVLEVKSGDTVSAKTATPDANMVSKEQDHTDVANGKTGESETTDLNVNGKEKSKKKPDSKNKGPTLAEILNLQSLEAAKGETGTGTTSTDNPESKKQKRQKLNKNRDLGDIVSTRESIREGLSTTKVLEIKNDETVSAKPATPDANMMSKEQDHAEVANGKTGESETTNNGNDVPKLTKSQKKNRRRALKKKLNANLGSLEKREDTATVDNKISMSNPAGTGEMGASTTTNLNGEVEVQQKVETSSGTNATDNTTLKKRKRQKMKNSNPDLGDILSTHENKQEGLSTTKVLEVKNDEMVSAKTAILDANMVSKEQDHTEVANDKTGESEAINVNLNGKKKRKRKPKSKNLEAADKTLGGNLDPLYLQNLEAADNSASKEQKRQEINNNPASGDILTTCENTSKVLEAVSAEVSQGEEHTKPKGPGKKLIILDVNGLLADVVSDLPNHIIADKYITRRAIFKRPYVHEFLSFCFEKFHVGIWSSRTMRNLVPVVDFLLGDLKKKLLFLWDGCKCTDSGVETLEVQYKNIVVKDLRKVWDEDGPNKSWVKGTFNESNTLLVDDSPYKGLLNPKYTGIFPASYSYTDSDDNFLGPKGELQTYLEGLAAADDVKTYVEQHPFGQGVIDEQNPDWVFYSSLIERLNDKPFMERLQKDNQWKRRRCC